MNTHTLTTLADNITGTTDIDIFEATYNAAVTDTFAADDFLNGGAGIDTLNIAHLLDVAITPPDNLWAHISNIEKIVINTTGNGAQTITTGTAFQAAFVAAGVDLTTITSGAGAINVTMTTFTGAATLKTTSTDGAQTIVTGSGATIVADARSGAGALTIKGVGLTSVSATTTGAGAQTIGDGSGNGAHLVAVTATSAGGAQTIKSTSTSAVTVAATSAAGRQTILTGTGADVITASTTDLSNTIGTDAGDDTITILATSTGGYTIKAGAGDDIVTGGAGNDTLIGGPGNDILDGGAGVDSMAGGGGSDIYYVDIATDVVTETSTSVTDIDTVNSSVSYILGVNLENLILTGTAVINGTGNALDNILVGGPGANTLNGGLGNDTLSGGAGADTLIGGLGNDVYHVGRLGDVVIETSTLATEIDTVNSSRSYRLGANVENLNLTGTAAVNGTGNALNNTLVGNPGANTLSGGAGADALIGGLGNDVYRVDNLGDVVTETSTLATEIDTVNSSRNYMLGANLENLTLIGTAAVNGTGNALNNSLVGNLGANILRGGLGNDVINGGAGNDFLAGGLGQDVFQISTLGNIDTIQGFSVIDDTVQLKNSAFTQLTTTGFLAPANFQVGGAATDVNDYIVYNSGTGALSYDADGNGAGAAVQIAILGTGLLLTNADFVVI